MAKFTVHHIRFFDFIPKAIHCIAYDEEGKKVAISRADNSLEIWSIKDDWFLEKVVPYSEGRSIEAIVWSGRRLFTAGLDGHVTEYDLLTLAPKESVPSYSGVIWCLTRNSSGTHLAAGTEGGSVVLFEISDGVLRYDRPLDKQEGRILSIAWHPTDDTIVTGGIDNIRIWSLNSGHAIQRLTLPRVEVNKETIVWCIAITSDMTIISGDSRGMTLFWNGKQGTLIQSFQSHQSDVLSLCVNKEGDSVFSSGVDPTLIQFEFTPVQRDSDWKQWVRSSVRKQHSHDVRAVVLAGDHVVTGGVDCNLIFNHMKDRKLNYMCRIPPIPHASLVQVAPSARLVLLQYSNYLEIWRLGNTREKSDINGALLKLSSNTLKLLQLKSKDDEAIVCSAISQDGEWLAYSDQNGIRLYQISVEHGSVVSPTISVSKVRHRPASLLPAHRLMFTPDGTKLVSASNQGTLQIVSVDKIQPNLIQTFSPKTGSEEPIHCLAISPNGEYLAAAHLNRMIQVYRISDLVHHCSLPRHETLPTALTFSPDSQNVLTAYCDQRITEYDLTSQEYTKWSRTAAKNWHPQWLKRRSKIQRIIVRQKSPHQILVQDEQTLCIIDKTQPFPDRGIKLYNKSDKAATPAGKISEHAFHICNKYKYLLHVGVLDDDCLVIVEQTPMKLMEALPATLKQKKFGT